MMKKLFIALSVAVCCVSLTPQQLQADDTRETIEKITLYLPNRILDLLDIFSVNIGVGPVVRAEMMGTRIASGGVSCGMAAMLFKDCNRQYGWGLQNGWNYEFPGFMQEDTERTGCSRLVKDYWEVYVGPQDPTRNIYEYFRGPRDYWQIGGALGCLVVGEVYINPIEWADLGLGFLMIDIKEDDLTFESFQ